MSYKNTEGYIMIKRPGIANTKSGYMPEHRAVWTDEHGDIPSGAVIHHIDGDKTNNHVSNLSLVDSNGEHRAQYHGAEYEGNTIAMFDLIDMIWIRQHLPIDRLPYREGMPAS